MTTYLPNVFPMPEGPGVSFTGFSGQTANFFVAEPGVYLVGYMCADYAANGDPNYGLNNPSQVLLQQVSGSTTTTILTFNIPGIQNTSVPIGGLTFNFKAAGPVKTVWMVKSRSGDNFR